MLQAFAVLLLNVVFMPYLLAAAIPIVLLFLFIRHYYLKSAREIKRLEALSKCKNVIGKILLCLLSKYTTLVENFNTVDFMACIYGID